MCHVSTASAQYVVDGADTWGAAGLARPRYAVDQGRQGVGMDVSFTLLCHQCGKPLEEASRLHSKPREVFLVPCSDCLGDAGARGYSRGQVAGYSEGYDEGLAAGEQAVRDDVKSMLRIVKEESNLTPHI